jgi:hypothetical protein
MIAVPDRQATSTPPTSGRAAPVVLGEWGLAGENSAITDAFDLPEGPTEFEVVTSGDGPIRVELLTADQKPRAILAEASSPIRVRKSVDVPAGQYAIRVEGQGTWELTVRPSGPAGGEQQR